MEQEIRLNEHNKQKYQPIAAGFLENVYQKALMIELKEKGIHANIETPINACYKPRLINKLWR